MVVPFDTRAYRVRIDADDSILSLSERQPYGNTQAPEQADILNIGGFSDAVFSVVSSFLSDDANRFVSEVEALEL